MTRKIWLVALLFLPTIKHATGCSGNVVDDISGGPVAGADVVLASPEGTGTKSDANGFFKLPVPSVGAYALSVSSRGYLRTVIDFNAPVARVDKASEPRFSLACDSVSPLIVRLVANPSIQGSVESETGTRLADVEVFGADILPDGRLVRASKVAKTDLDGQFRLHRMGVGLFALVAIAKAPMTGKAAFLGISDPISVGHNEQQRSVSIVIRSGGLASVGGLIEGASLTENLLVSLVRDPADVLVGQQAVDTSGKFRFTLVSPGTYKIYSCGSVRSVLSDGLLLSSPAFCGDVQVEVSDRDLLDVHVPRSEKAVSTVTFTAQDNQLGDVIRGRLLLRSIDPWREITERVVEFTSGSKSLVEGLPFGAYSVTSLAENKQACYSWPRHIVVSSTMTAVSLKSCGEIYGHFSTSQNYVRPVAITFSPTINAVRVCFLDPYSHFFFPGLEPAHYSVAVKEVGQQFSTATSSLTDQYEIDMTSGLRGIVEVTDRKTQ